MKARMTAGEIEQYFNGLLAWKPCCGNCRHWNKHSIALLGTALGWCEVNYQHELGGSTSRAQTLDLAVCSKWQPKEDPTPDVA